MADKVALITGGTRGIGLGIAKTLVREGFALMVCGVREDDLIADVLESLRNSGGEAEYRQADVSVAADLERLIEAVRERFARLDVLVNNAGVAPEQRMDVLETTAESYERVMKINLQGPFFLSQLAAQWMIKQKDKDEGFGGCIINISSISATMASPNRGEYCISKAGLSMLTQLFAVRLADYGIPVYEVRPGIARTDMTTAVTEHYDKLIDEGLLLQARWCTPYDVGKAVAALVRGDLAYSTGQVLMVDGGLTVSRL